MSDQIEAVQLKSLLNSLYYSLMVDETTDISIVKEMVLYTRFFDCNNGSVVTFFLKIMELRDGRAESIEDATLSYLRTNSIPLSRLVGFGSDGAAAMTGSKFGVSTRLKQKQTILVSIHCVAHRLALAAGQA